MELYTISVNIRLLYLLCFLLLGAISNAQDINVSLSLKERFFQADSVTIISHEDLVLTTDTIPGKMGT